MAKLVDILARELVEWPKDVSHIGQASNGDLVAHYYHDGFGFSYMGEVVEVAENFIDGHVNSAQWQAARASYLASIQPERDADIEKVVDGTKKLPYAFTEADIRAAFEAGANWMRGAVADGAAEYVDKLKGLK